MNNLQLMALNGLKEYLDAYNNGDVTNAPSTEALQAYQKLYIHEQARQRGLEVENAKREKLGKPIIEAVTDLKDYDKLLDNVIKKKNPAKAQPVQP